MTGMFVHSDEQYTSSSSFFGHVYGGVGVVDHHHHHHPTLMTLGGCQPPPWCCCCNTMVVVYAHLVHTQSCTTWYMVHGTWCICLYAAIHRVHQFWYMFTILMSWSLQVKGPYRVMRPPKFHVLCHNFIEGLGIFF